MGNHKTLVAIVALLVMSISFSGCESLRKKFTRQKKKSQVEDNNFIPVLEPLEYPALVDDPEAGYKEHYALIKVWYKDLWAALDNKGAEKQTRYVLKQVYSHLDDMSKLVSTHTQMQITKLKELLKYYDESLNSSEHLRNKSRIQSDLRAFHRLLVKELNPGQLKWKD